MTAKAYLNDHALSGSATITAAGETDGKPWVQLDRTLFHPQGGGQKSDRGTIGGVPVIHVAHAEEGEVLHYVETTEGLAPGKAVEIAVDPEWRSLNTHYHTAGHLIAAVIEKTFPQLEGVAAHHWPGEARVEFAGDPKPSPEEVEQRLAEDLLKAIDADWPVTCVGDPFTSRAIRVGESRAIPCGGTHVRSAGELNPIEITRVRSKSGKLRVSYSTS